MRRALAAGVVVLLALLGSAGAVLGADPPSNDAFANATRVDAFEFSDTIDLSAAMPDDGEPTTCGAPTKSVWYRYTVGSVGAVVARVTGTTSTDYRLATFSSADDTLSSLTRVACRIAGTPSTARVQPGLAYYLRVSDNGGGGGTLTVTLTFYLPPSNDSFSGATPVGDLPWTDTVQQYAASVETGEPNQCGLSATSWPDRRTVWYAFDATSDGQLTVDTAVDIVGVEARVVPFAAGGTGWNGTAPGACGTGPASTFTVHAGRTYFVQVVNYSGQGTLTVTLSFATVPPPTNDSFANAMSIVGPSFTDQVDTTWATGEPGEPPPCGGSSERTLWYSYAATEYGRLAIWATGAFADSGLFVPYVATDDGFSGLKALGCGMGSGGITVGTQPGSTYYIQAGFIGSSGYPAPGVYTLNASFTPSPPPPVNDARANAIVVTGFPFIAPTVDTTGATGEPWGEPSQSCGGSARSVWYSLTPEDSGSVTIDTSGFAFTDAVINVYGGPWGSAVTCSTSGSATFGVQAGITYEVQVSDAGSGGGPLPAAFSFAPPSATGPANDDFADATAVSTFPFTDSVNIMTATSELDEPYSWCGRSARTVWYKLTPSHAGEVAVRPGNTWFHSVVAVYRATGPGVGGLDAVACSDLQWGTLLVFEVKAGEAVYLQAADLDPGGGLGITIEGPADGLVDVAGYDVLTTAASGFGCWSHTYTGTVTDTGRRIQDSGCSPTPVVNEIGGGGTLSDGSRMQAQLFTIRPDADGVMIEPVIVLHLAEPIHLGSIEFLAERGFDVFAGAVTSATIEVDGVIQTVDAVPFGGSLNDDRFVTTGSPLAAPLSDTVVIRDFTLAQWDQFTIGEIAVFAGEAPPDVTPPTVSYDGHPASYALNDQVRIACTATDDISVASTTCADVDAMAWELGIGTHEYSATATDAAGNVGTASTSFDVVATYPSMMDLTRRWAWKAGLAGDLVAKLAAAQRADARGNTKSEAAILDDYRALLHAQAGKSISAADAERLISFSYGL